MKQQGIGHIWYINILAWPPGFQNKLLYLMVFSIVSIQVNIKGKGTLVKKNCDIALKASDPS